LDGGGGCGGGGCIILYHHHHKQRMNLFTSFGWMTEDGRSEGLRRELVVLDPLLDPLADNELPLDRRDALSENPESLSGLSVRPPRRKRTGQNKGQFHQINLGRNAILSETE